MKRVMMCMVVAAGVLAFGAGLAVGADGPAVSTTPGATTGTLPDAVSAAISQAFPKATFKATNRIVDIRGVTFVVAMTEGAKTFNVLVNEAGVITTVYTPIAVADLPKAVADAVNAGANGVTTLAVRIELPTNYNGTIVFNPPHISYSIRQEQEEMSRTLQVAEDGTVGTPLPKLSDAAKAAIAQAFPRATIGMVLKYGKTFEVGMTEGARTFSVYVNESSVILSVHTPIAVANLPKPVADAVAAGGNGATTDSARRFEMRRSPDGKKVLSPPQIVYRILLVQGEMSGRMLVAEDGTVISRLTLKPTPKHRGGSATPSN